MLYKYIILKYIYIYKKRSVIMAFFICMYIYNKTYIK